jgi:hypothetical protein
MLRRNAETQSHVVRFRLMLQCAALHPEIEWFNSPPMPASAH